jgi:cation:H+ antiporter
VNGGLLVSGCLAMGGLVLLLVGGEVLLRGAVSLAYRLGLSHLLVGLTVVAAATSMPELVVVVASGLEGHAALGVGNVIGSNIANTLLILGVAAMLYPISTRLRHVVRDGAIGVAAAVLFAVFAMVGTLDWPNGLIMLALLVGYIIQSYRAERAQPSGELDPPSERDRRSLGECLLLFVGGLCGLLAGSRFLIDGSVDIARSLGVSEAAIGLTLVAVGTSLPELATAVVAGYRRHSEVALGNILGSNLFNILAILGTLALASPFSLSAALWTDLWIMVAVMVILLPVMWTGWRIGRREGLMFLLLYGCYMVLVYLRSFQAPL